MMLRQTLSRACAFAVSLLGAAAAVSAIAAPPSIAPDSRTASVNVPTSAAPAVPAAHPGSQAPAAPLSAAAGRQLMDKYCMDCHNYTDSAGGVEFEVYDPGAAHDDAQLTEKMLKKLRAGMPAPTTTSPDFTG
jgi:mono/diheme cytochrome c family protein